GHDRTEDHDQGVHRGHLVEELRVDDLHAGHEQLGTDDQRHRAANEEHQQREQQVQGTDVLVVGSEEPAIDKAGLVVVCVVGCGVRGHGLPSIRMGYCTAASVSPAVMAVAAVAAPLASASFCASQASNSSRGTALTTMGMKPWSLPHSSAHWPR